MENKIFHTHESEDELKFSRTLYCERYLCGYHLIYTMFEKVEAEHITKYLISVRLDGDVSDETICDLGAGIERAIKFFSLVSDNCVMPGTLEDVLQDFNYSELIKA